MGGAEQFGREGGDPALPVDRQDREGPILVVVAVAAEACIRQRVEHAFQLADAQGPVGLAHALEHARHEAAIGGLGGGARAIDAVQLLDVEADPPDAVVQEEVDQLVRTGQGLGGHDADDVERHAMLLQ